MEWQEEACGYGELGALSHVPRGVFSQYWERNNLGVAAHHLCAGPG